MWEVCNPFFPPRDDGSHRDSIRGRSDAVFIEETCFRPAGSSFGATIAHEQKAQKQGQGKAEGTGKTYAV